MKIHQVSKNNQVDFRVGYGVDVHQLVVGSPLIIGGVHIECAFGAQGHSDADVLLHAVCDAILGGAALRDIGVHFPDSDEKYKGVDSKILLTNSYNLVKEAGYVLGNLDSTVMLELPKISLKIPEMQKVMADIFDVDENRISVKAKTAERLGYIGEGKGIKAYCTVLLFKNE